MGFVFVHISDVRFVLFRYKNLATEHVSTIPAAKPDRKTPVARVTINANELMQLLGNHQLSVLIMDCRPKSEFDESHFTKQICLNVPEEIIELG